MPKKFNHTQSFAHFGTVPKNVQWSWSARNEDTKTVVVTLWQDEFTKKDGKRVYERGPIWEGARNRHGHHELMENLQWALANCEGRVKTIIAIAKDKAANPRSIKECFPSSMRLRVTHCDPVTGSFAFEDEQS